MSGVYRTYDEWKAANCQVRKGEKSRRKNENGVALFSSKQIKVVSQHSHGEDGYDQEDYDQWYDTYGYTRDWI